MANIVKYPYLDDVRFSHLQKCITALEKMWHPEHFFCAQCGRQFGDEDFHEKNGKAYCRSVALTEKLRSSMVCLGVESVVCSYLSLFVLIVGIL